MYFNRTFLYLFIVLSNYAFTQNIDTTKVFSSSEIIKPSIISTHPFGIFFSRWQGNFQTKTYNKYHVTITLESGNIWSPPVTAFIPNDQDVRDLASTVAWHRREAIIDTDAIDAKTLEVQNDGVIRGLRLNFNVPVNSKSELKIGLRSFLLTKGKFPFSIITNDDTIEYFHENIAGGDDPFDRRLYPLNEALIRYKDRNNNVMTIENGDFILSGVEFSYYRYSQNLIKGFAFNYASHVGINTSKYNKSVDIGASANIIKNIYLKNENTLNIGLGLGVTKNNLIGFSDKNIDFSNNTYIGYLENIIEYSHFSKRNKTLHSFGVDFYFQSSLNKKSEFDYIIPTKNGTSFKSWNSGISNLYQNNNYWTLMYSFTRKMTTIFYLQQDLTVNNNPDLQTGICFRFNI